MAQSSKAAKRERQRQNRAVKLEQQAAVEKRQRFWRSARGFIIILVPIAALFVFFALRGGGNDSSSSSKSDKSSQSTKSGASSLPAPSGITIDPAKTYTATIETTEGTIEIALDAANAPTSVNNFVYLTKAGSPDNTTGGGPGYTVQAELPTSAYEVGSVAWAKTSAEPAGTAGSQFFIGTGSNVTSLPKDYGYIGKVTKGLDVAQKIMGFAPSSGDGKPTTNVKMTKVTISES